MHKPRQCIISHGGDEEEAGSAAGAPSSPSRLSRFISDIFGHIVHAMTTKARWRMVVFGHGRGGQVWFDG